MVSSQSQENSVYLNEIQNLKATVSTLEKESNRLTEELVNMKSNKVKLERLLASAD